MHGAHGYLAAGRTVQKVTSRRRNFRISAERTRTHTEHHERASSVPCLQPITASNAAHTVHPRVHVTSSLF